MLMARYSHKRRIRNSRAGVSHGGMCVNMNKMCVYVFMRVEKWVCVCGEEAILRN